MTGQLDLFGAMVAPLPQPLATIKPPARPAIPEMIPTPRTVAWARRLMEAGPDLETRIMVTRLWTGVAEELLALGPAGRWYLRNDGEIIPIKADPGCHARIVYMDPDGVRALHAKHPLIPTVRGTHCFTYRFAKPDEAASVDLPVPEEGASEAQAPGA